ncbi:hypothetical protein C8J56DRAFT_1048411 [Mycena floridula]|nr:hypothetical protein C8J56DRAFT_1048411 [Mycena floridula]
MGNHPKNHPIPIIDQECICPLCKCQLTVKKLLSGDYAISCFPEFRYYYPFSRKHSDEALARGWIPPEATCSRSTPLKKKKKEKEKPEKEEKCMKCASCLHGWSNKQCRPHLCKRCCIATGKACRVGDHNPTIASSSSNPNIPVTSPSPIQSSLTLSHTHTFPLTLARAHMSLSTLTRHNHALFDASKPAELSDEDDQETADMKLALRLSRQMAEHEASRRRRHHHRHLTVTAPPTMTPSAPSASSGPGPLSQAIEISSDDEPAVRSQHNVIELSSDDERPVKRRRQTRPSLPLLITHYAYPGPASGSSLSTPGLSAAGSSSSSSPLDLPDVSSYRWSSPSSSQSSGPAWGNCEF